MTNEQRFHGVAIIIAVSILFTAPASASAVILWGAPANTSDLVTIDSMTGLVVNTYSSPIANDLVTGLTLAEEGASLLYASGTTSNLYRLDPTNATILNTYTLPVSKTGGLTYQTNAGADSIFAIGQSGVARQLDFNGSVSGFIGGGGDFPGAAGGDDNGRHFYVAGSGIREFNPTTGTNGFIGGPAPEPLGGLAYDGQFIYASGASSQKLYTINPDTGAVVHSVNVTTAALVGLAATPVVTVPVETPPSIDEAFLHNGTEFVDGDITVPEGTASVLARATVSDAGTEDVNVTIGSLAPITVTGGNGTTGPDATLSSPVDVYLADEGVVPVTFDASDGTSSATQVTRNITVTNVAPTMDFLTASYNPTIMLIDDDSVVASALSVPLGTEVTFAFEINDPGLADGITASFDMGGTIFNFGPTINGTLAESFLYTFSSAEDVVISLSFSDGDGGDVEMTSAITVSVQASATPEPGSLLIMLIGATLGVFASVRPRRDR